MLQRFRGLESLTICIFWPIPGDSKRVQWLVDAVDRHKDTLKYLLLHYDWRPRKSAIYDAKLFDVIKTCKNLSQRGISLYKSKMIDVCKVGTFSFEPGQKSRRLTYQVGIT